jgi:hypothetical protein
MLGLGKLAMLSTDLLKHLHHKHLFFLYQFTSSHSEGLLSDRWLSSEELEVGVDLAVEWDCYT